MQNLTLQEFIILVVGLAAIIAVVIAIVKSSTKIFIAVLTCCMLFSGFTWLPEKIKEWTGSNINPTPINEYIDTDKVNNAIDDVKNKVNEYVEENGQSWIDAGKSLWNKILGVQEKH